MRILFVVPNVPSYIRPRPLHFIRDLSKQHEVSVVCLASNDSDQRYVSQLRQYCHRLEVVRLSRWRSVLNCFLAIFSKRALRCAYFDSPRLRSLIQARVEAGEVGLLHAEHLKTLPMIQPALGRVPAVFDAVDCLSMLVLRRRSVTKNPFLKLFSWTESRKLQISEAEALQRFDRVTISSPVDKSAYPAPSAIRERIDVVSNGVDLEYFGFRRFEPKRNSLVFCAKLDYFPNEDAALYFVRSVWPLLRPRLPELSLDIVGSRPPRSVRRLDGKNNIRVIPSVPDVRPHLGRAWIALCPIRIRAGIQNKMLEAMALGVPLVASAICCEGLSVVPGKHLLVAEDPAQFAGAIESLLTNVNLRGKIIHDARAYVERHHNWSESVKALLKAYEQANVAFAARTIPFSRKHSSDAQPASKIHRSSTAG